MSTPAQIKRIKTMQKAAGLADSRYRDLLAAHGVRSSTELDEAGADRLIADLRRLSGDAGAGAPAIRATGRFAGKLQALWIAGYDLNVIDDRTDRALLAYVARQTGVDHTRFLNDPALAEPAIEGLKAWIARDGGVRWPSVVDPRAHGKAVVEALGAKLLAAGDNEVGLQPYLFGHRHGLPNLPVNYTLHDLHALARRLGDRLRARRAAKAVRAKAKRRRAA